MVRKGQRKRIERKRKRKYKNNVDISSFKTNWRSLSTKYFGNQIIRSQKKSLHQKIHIWSQFSHSRSPVKLADNVGIFCGDSIFGQFLILILVGLRVICFSALPMLYMFF